MRARRARRVWWEICAVLWDGVSVLLLVVCGRAPAGREGSVRYDEGRE